MTRRLDGRLCWIVGQLPGPIPVSDPIAVILVRIPGLLPGTAAVVARHLADEDAWVRNAVDLRPSRQPLPGVACPHCGQRQLVVQTAAPVDVWTVVCATGRLCTGQGCPCGMPGAVEGVAHIWPRSVVVGAVAGAAPTSAPTDRSRRDRDDGP